MADLLGIIAGRKMRRSKEEALSSLEDLKEAEKERTINQRIEANIHKKYSEMGVDEKLIVLESKVDRMAEKLDELAYSFEMNSRKVETPTRKKIKIKEMIKLMLTQHGKLTAMDMGRMLSLSRTRCSEYLKEMEKEGALMGTVNCRKRFYEIRHDG